MEERLTIEGMVVELSFGLRESHSQHRSRNLTLVLLLFSEYCEWGAL